MLSIEGLTVALPPGADRSNAVEKVSLSIAAGETLCIVGESGSGKSVMATTVMGLLPKALCAQQGKITLKGESLLNATPQRLRTLRGKAMGMVFQEPMTALNPILTCGNQVDELLRTHTDWSISQRKTAIVEMFEHVHLPEAKRIYDSYPHQLSGGQRQRIVIAMAVILKPALLICDEPTTALDVTTQKEILRLIAELQQDQGCAVMFITHDMGIVAEIAHRILVMYQGHAIEHGVPENVLSKPQQAYTQKLLAAVPSMQPPPPKTLASAEVLLQGQALHKTYISRSWLGKHHSISALKNLNLSLRRGEILGVVGESGSGKSTLARCLMRLLEPSSGSIQWCGTDVAHLSEKALRPLRNRIQIVFQDPNRSFNPRRTIEQSLIEGAMNFGSTYPSAQQLARELMRRVKLDENALARYPHQFSGGQRQRLAIARALACKPSILIADEATSALDVSVQAQILELLREIQSQYALGIILITHDLRVAAQLCDHVIVMQHGAIVEQGITQELYAKPQHIYTQKLFASAPQSRYLVSS